MAVLGALVIAGCGDGQRQSGSPQENLEPKLAFVLGAEQLAIWTVSPDGSDRRRVVGPEDLDGLSAAEPSWSPDGRLLAFVAHDRKRERSNLYVSKRDGSGLRRLTDDFDRVGSPSWSPDGKRLLVVRAVGSGTDAETTLETISVDGADRRVLKRLGPGVKNGFFTGADWSSTGTIAVGRIRPVSGKGELAIWLLDPDGANLRRVLPNASSPAWSPDAKSLAFLRATEEGPPCIEDCAMHAELYVASADGSAVRRVSAAEDIGLQAVDRPSWSPSGDEIVFAGLDRGWDLYVVSAAGDSAGNLTASEDWERSPDWSG